jgi:hypothetical protein
MTRSFICDLRVIKNAEHRLQIGPELKKCDRFAIGVLRLSHYCSATPLTMNAIGISEPP